MKTIMVTVSVEPKRSIKSRLFGLVEGERFRYRATVKNVGEEPVGSKDQDPDGRVTNLAAIEFVWAFPTGQVVVRRFPFPDNLASNTSHTFPEVDHDILSSGFALLSVRLWWTGAGLNLAVQGSAGRNVPIPDSLE